MVVSSVAGNIIEQYDFLLYGFIATLAFGPLFFPTFSPLAATLASLSTFAVGFVARPLGSIVCGHYGDRIGRKSMLVMTLSVAGGSTFLMGLLPTYESIGGWAPVLLVSLRFLQGFSFGGEYGGAVLMVAESAPAARRGFYSGFVPAGSPAGLFLAALAVLLVSAMPRDAFLVWGWRLPFLFSIVLVLIGLIIRLTVDETPVFAAVRSTTTTEKMPVIAVLRRNPGRILLASGVSFGFGTLLYVSIVFLITYGTGTLGLSATPFLVGILVGSVAMIGTILWSCTVSDRVGRRPVIIGGAMLLAVLAFPFFWLIDSGSAPLIWLGMAIVLAAGGAVYGPLAPMISELFSTRLRYSGASLGYQLGQTIGGGFSPLIAAWLLAWSGGQSWIVSLYLLLAALVAAASTYFLVETARTEL
ncbi:MFS transporter [Pseudonocardia aurantiaca]|uniref:MFS transporter n=1 Tax=Pseudonocardia aurantiaca TaxID=75290 RepID=A0ABW4FX29_9PSEU